VHPNVKKLLDLQTVDQEIVSLRRDTSSLPAEEAKRKKKLDEIDKVASEKKDRSTKAELDYRALEKAVKQSDDEVKKLNERLNGVKNNAEYQATLFQIESVVRERDRVQDECLRILETTDPLKAEATAAAAPAAALALPCLRSSAVTLSSLASRDSSSAACSCESSARCARAALLLAMTSAMISL
jgi:predicted  nucleic acid-binding Zn-ribbon protein